MASLSSTPTRSIPLQERSSRRIAHFLEVAGELIAEVGYDAMTMTQVAERANASIGALYRWFPDKASLAQALRSQYGSDLHRGWGPLMLEAMELPTPQFAEAMVDRMAVFCREHPAYLPLMSAPIQYAKDPEARKNLRDQFTEVIRAHKPDISEKRALLVANVSFQIIKGLIALYRETPEEGWGELTQEVKTVLTLYLSKSLAR